MIHINLFVDWYILSWTHLDDIDLGSSFLPVEGWAVFGEPKSRPKFSQILIVKMLQPDLTLLLFGAESMVLVNVYIAMENGP